MLANMPTDFTAYQLTLHIKRPIQISVGKLGDCFFAAGYYIYTGSAKRNIESRLERHLKKYKKLRWHIDYLTVHPLVEVVQVTRSHQSECTLNQAVEGTVLVSGFGSSDCQNRCSSHLRYLGDYLSGASSLDLT
jgi:Uri superfamily endonuclease